MGRIAPDGKRTAHGFKALRQRYVRRAEYLSRDTQFLEAVHAARNRWNFDYPQYPIVADSVEYGPPVNMRREHYAKAEQLQGKRWPGTAEFRAMPEVYGWWDWGTRAFELAERFWPGDDFPNPYQPEIQDREFAEFLMSGDDPTKGDIRFSGYLHPARSLIEKCMYCDPRVIELDRYIDLPGLSIELMSDARDEIPDRVIDFASYRPVYCVPIYPGITATDIQEAAGDLARQAEQVFGDRTAGARVRALRAEGLTYQQIAARLGMHVSTVASIHTGEIGTTEKQKNL